MVNGPVIINPGASITASIPLVESRFGKGFGFTNQNQDINRTNNKDIEIELSLSAQRRSAGKPDGGPYLSDSPLLQAVDVLSALKNRLQDLQQEYQKAATGSRHSEVLAAEFNSVAQEFKRITNSSVFQRSDASSDSSAALSYTDRSINSVYSSGDPSRITALNQGISGLKEISFENALQDRALSATIEQFIDNIRNAIKPENKRVNPTQPPWVDNGSVLIPVPQVELKNIGASQGLNISLIGLNNEDLIKAAATHVNLESINVLLLTYNAPEPDTEKEKEEKEQEQALVEVRNPESLL